MGITNIPYNPAGDPWQHLAAGAENAVSGALLGFERRRQIGDIRDVSVWAENDFKGSPPKVSTTVGQQLLSRLTDPLVRSQIDFNKARMQALSVPEPEKYGVTPWYLSPRWADTPQGSQAQEKALAGTTDEEKLKWWQGVQASAAGTYYYPGEGLAGGAKEPKNPKLYALASKKVEEIMAKMGQTAAGNTTSGNAAGASAAGEPGFNVAGRDLMNLPVVITDADYDELEPGTEFIDPEGKRYRKPLDIPTKQGGARSDWPR